MIKVPSLSNYVICAHVHFRFAGVRRLTSKRAGERGEVLSVILRGAESNNFLKRRSTEPLLAGRRLHDPVLLISRLAGGCIQPKERVRKVDDKEHTVGDLKIQNNNRF
jgi:hypothetical protein